MSEFLQKPAGRCCDIMPGDNSFYVYVDGQPWARFDTIEKAEFLRNSIVQGWANYYEAIAAEVTK
jgi:hypothetical protein